MFIEPSPFGSVHVCTLIPWLVLRKTCQETSWNHSFCLFLPLNIQEGGINGVHHAVGPCMFLPGCTFGGAKKSKTVAFGKRTNPEEKETSGQRQGGDGWWSVVVKCFKTWPHHFGATHFIWSTVGLDTLCFLFGLAMLPCPRKPYLNHKEAFQWEPFPKDSVTGSETSRCELHV